MAKKYECFIEVKVLYCSERWQELLDGKMKQILAQLRTSVEELGGEISVRY
jgi:hypothetical protein